MQLLYHRLTPVFTEVNLDFSGHLWYNYRIVLYEGGEEKMGRDSDLELTISIRDNEDSVEELANKYLAEKKMEGIVLAFHILNIYENDPESSPFSIKYRTIIIDDLSFGKRATGNCQKQSLKHIKDYHVCLIEGKRPIRSGSQADKDMATKRITIEAGERHKVDALLAVWGSSPEINQEFLDRFSAGL